MTTLFPSYRVTDLDRSLAFCSRLVQWPAGAAGPRTAFLDDPDGYRIELVQWPKGHPDGITAADFAGAETGPPPTTEPT